MDQTFDVPPNDIPLNFSGPEWALILTGALLLRAVPILIFVGALLKLRRFPALRPLHILLLLSVILTGTLGLIDSLAPNVIPMALRTSGLWSFLWIFAVAWLAVTWTRSAFKTRLRPRIVDIATLVAIVALGIAASGLFLPMAFSG